MIASIFAIVGSLSAYREHSVLPIKTPKRSGIVHKGPNFIFFQSATDFIKVCPNIKAFSKWPPNRYKYIMSQRFFYTGISETIR